MLLFPEGNERRLDRMAQRAEAVDAGMAGGAQSNQEARLMDPGSAVMHRQFMADPQPRQRRPSRSKISARRPAKRRRECYPASSSGSTIRHRRGVPPRKGRKAGPAHRAAKRCALVARAGPGKAFYRRASGKKMRIADGKQLFSLAILWLDFAQLAQLCQNMI